MTRVLELVALGFAGGTTFTLLLLSGARRANAPRPPLSVIRAGDPPIDLSSFERDDAA